jgi:hypothetical protein
VRHGERERGRLAYTIRKFSYDYDRRTRNTQEHTFDDSKYGSSDISDGEAYAFPGGYRRGDQSFVEC